MTMYRGDESSAGNITLSGSFILSYEELKYLHGCTHCGFEAKLYESEYECPICRKGTMCRAAQNITTWTGLWEPYELSDEPFSSDDSPSMASGFWYTRGGL